MNLFTNKIFLGMSFFLLLIGCDSSKNNPKAEAVVEAEISVNAENSKTESQIPAEAPKPVAQKTKVLSPDETIARLKQWDKDLLSLKTSFVQITEYDGVSVSRSQGTLYYDKNRHLLRLDTQDGDGAVTQSAITDKKEIIILDETGKQVTQVTWNEWQQGQPNQALFDFGNYAALLARHQVKAIQPHHLALTPKSGEDYTLYLTLSPQDYFPTTIQIVSGDLMTRADLTATQKNISLPKDTFGGFFR
ncbi:MAG: outer membrane lipoprotein carrier protein LolA [Elusimicrobiaceae bacterium]|nr:outer membrane lipoprotein carrier protein LolA [Elusimicrobiaceae bacterium]